MRKKIWRRGVAFSLAFILAMPVSIPVYAEEEPPLVSEEAEAQDIEKEPDVPEEKQEGIKEDSKGKEETGREGISEVEKTIQKKATKAADQTVVAKIGDVEYSTLASAVDAVKDNETIVLQGNFDGSGVQVASGKKFTIDFGGYTYNVTDPTVGSAETETNCFQLLKDSTITFKNGTITTAATQGYILIQNYSNLTLENIDLIGSEKTEYVLSNNNGNIVIGAGTNITAAKGMFAFDVCRYSSYPSVKVTVAEGTEKITGKIELSASNNDAKDGFELDIKGGNFDEASINISSGGQLATVKKSENVNVQAPNGYAWYENQDGSQSLKTLFAQIESEGKVNNYSSFEEAYQDVQDGQTLTLMSDFVINEGSKYELGKSFVLNLNGHTILNKDSGDRPLVVKAHASVTIDGTTAGSIVNLENNKSYGLVEVEVGASLHVKGGEYKGNTDNGSVFRVLVPEEVAGDTETNLRLTDLKVNITNRVVTTGPNTLPKGNQINIYISGGTYESSGSTMFYSDTIERSPFVFEHVTAINNSGKPIIELAGSEGTFNNCTFDVRDVDSNNFSDTAIFVGYEGKAIINGGTYNSKGHALYIGTSGGEIVVNDGTFFGEKGSIRADTAESYKSTSNVEIYGGAFKGKLETKSWKEGAATIEVFGGAFDQSVPEEYCAEGFVPKDNGNGTFGVELPEEKAIASVNGMKYTTLSKAVEKASDGATITLLQNTTESVVVKEGQNVIFDLNGKTLSGGTVSGKAALRNEGTLIIKDSSGTDAGKIIREDNGTRGYYTVDNQGMMTIESGTIYNRTGKVPSGASLIRNAGDGKEATLHISGGNIGQDGFIAIKNDDYGILKVTGGKIWAKDEVQGSRVSAVQNWSSAEISGGTLEGALWTSVWSNAFPASVTNVSGTAVVKGDIVVEPYDKGLNINPELHITGGTIYSKDYEWVVKNGGKVVASGGVFDEELLKEYCAEGFAPEKNAEGNWEIKELKIAAIGDTTYGTLEKAVQAAQAGDTINLLEHVTLKDRLNINKAITLDIGNYTVTGKIEITSPDVKFVGSGTITSDAKGDTKSDATIIVRESGALNIENIKVANTAQAEKNTMVIFVEGKLVTEYATIEAPHVQGIACFASCNVTLNHTKVEVNANALTSSAAGSKSEMVVNLNGVDFVTKDDTVWNAGPIYWPSHGTLNIVGGTFTGGNTNVAALYQKNGTVNIKGDATFSARDGVKLGAEAEDTTEITLNIAGGNFKGARSGLYYKTTSAGKNCKMYSVNITGGTFRGDESAIYHSVGDSNVILPEVSVQSGMFKGGKNGDISGKESAKDSLKISGGWFSQKVSAEYCVDTFAPTDDRTDRGAVDREMPYTVAKKVTLTFKNGSNVIHTLADAAENKLDISAVTEPTQPEQTEENKNYTFIGWYSSSGEKISGYYPIEDTEYQAKWKVMDVIPDADTIGVGDAGGTAMPDEQTSGEELAKTEAAAKQEADTILQEMKDKDEITEGDKATVVISVNADVKDANAPDIREDAKKVSEKIDEKEKISGYIDVTVTAKTIVTNSAGVEETKTTKELTKTKTEIPVTLALDSSINLSTTYIRVAHVHEGNVEFIPYVLNKEDRTLTVRMKEFSTLAIVTSEGVEVTFDTNDGSEVKRQMISSGKTLTEPEAPSRAGYTFLGWFKEGETTAYDFATPVTSDLKLVARWRINEYTVSFDLNDGEGTIAEQNVEYNGKVAEPETPVRTGYTFLGWFKAGSTEEYNFENPVTSNLKLVAHWRINEYTVSFELNGGQGTTESQKIHYQGIAVKPTEEPTKEGYTFLGWFKEGETTAYDFATPITSNLKLVAHWKLEEPIFGIVVDKKQPYADDSVTLTTQIMKVDGLKYSVQWLKNGVAIKDAVSEVLEVEAPNQAERVKYSAKVTVSDGEHVITEEKEIILDYSKHVVSIQFAKKEVKVHIKGDTIENALTVGVDRILGRVSYESDNKKVATVDAKTGVVTIVGAGKTTITAKIEETETHKGTKAEYTLVVTEHEFGDWTVTKKEDCTNVGLKIRSCSICKEEETKVIPALGHNLIKTEKKEATCTEDGNIEYWTCERCGELFKDSAGKETINQEETILEAQGHSYGEWVITDATCTEEGKKERTCKVCDIVETEIIPALGHGDAKHIEAVAPTAEKEGNIEYWICRRCGAYFKNQDMTESVKPNEVIIPKKENISGSNEDEEKPSVKPENQPEKPVDKEQSDEVKTGDTTSSIMIFVYAMLCIVSVGVCAMMMYRRRRR